MQVTIVVNIRIFDEYNIYHKEHCNTLDWKRMNSALVPLTPTSYALLIQVQLYWTQLATIIREKGWIEFLVVQYLEDDYLVNNQLTRKFHLVKNRVRQVQTRADFRLTRVSVIEIIYQVHTAKPWIIYYILYIIGYNIFTVID